MPRNKSTPKRLDISGGVPEGQGGSSAASSKPRAKPDEEEEADLDDIMPGISAPAASSSSSSSVPAAKRKREAPAFPSSSTSGKEKKAGAASSVKYFEVEGETPEDLAAAYITADAASQPSYETMGFHHQQQLMMTARIEAARKKDAVDFERKEGSDGRRGSFVARFMGNKKKFEDDGPLYSADEVADVFAAVMRRQSTKRRKATASSPAFTLDQLALRSPPFFWSLYHAFGGDVSTGLKTVLSEAEEMTADP